MDANLLRSRLRTAVDAATVVAIVNEFLAAIAPEQRAQLPAGCVPSHIATADDLGYWALKLAQADLAYRGPAATAELLREMREVLADAVERMTRIRYWARQ